MNQWAPIHPYWDEITPLIRSSTKTEEPKAKKEDEKRRRTMSCLGSSERVGLWRERRRENRALAPKTHRRGGSIALAWPLGGPFQLGPMDVQVFCCWPHWDGSAQWPSFPGTRKNETNPRTQTRPRDVRSINSLLIIGFILLCSALIWCYFLDPEQRWSSSSCCTLRFFSRKLRKIAVGLLYLSVSDFWQPRFWFQDGRTVLAENTIL